MLIAGKEFPSKCPDNCAFLEDTKHHGQNSICVCCPVFNCPDLLGPENFRRDWAEEWFKFFESGYKHLPQLHL